MSSLRYCVTSGCPDCERYMRERDEARAEYREETGRLLARLAKVPALVEKGRALVDAYQAASVSDEEGLLMLVDPVEMRRLWQAVDDAAEALEELVAEAEGLTPA